MKIDQQKSLLTVMAIMGSAFILFSMGCGSSKSTRPAPAAAAETQVETGGKKSPGSVSEADQTPIDQAKDVNKVKECSANEYADLKSLKTLLADSDQQVKSLGDQKKWTLNSKVLQSSQKSAVLCEKLLTRHRPAACKKTIADSIATVYSYKKIKAECELSQKYYNQYKTAQAPQPVKPPVKQPDTPVVAEPSVPQTPAPVVQQPQAPAGTYPTCTTAEFQKLSTWSAELDSANKNITRLGGKSQWKYDSAAISTATAAKKSCEALISYHSQSPCQKSIKQADGKMVPKTYDQSIIRQRCETARTYFYEFTQRTSTLNEKNADLYLDISRLGQQSYEPQEQKSYQNCVVHNPTDSRIDYTNQKALVISSRGFEDKIMVLETQEGLLLQCYSLGLDGPFSKRQVLNNLSLDKTYINLEYVLK